MTNLDAQYQAAQGRLRTADDAVRRASRERLAALMRLSERERFEHVTDADLTPQDRAELQASIAAKLTRPRRPLFRSISLKRFWRQLRPRSLARRGLWAATIAPLLVWAMMAWLHTGRLTAWDRPMTLVWTLPSGGTSKSLLEAGAPLVLVHHPGVGSYFRYWLPKRGYATAEVNVIQGEN